MRPSAVHQIRMRGMRGIDHRGSLTVHTPRHVPDAGNLHQPFDLVTTYHHAIADGGFPEFSSTMDPAIALS